MKKSANRPRMHAPVSASNPRPASGKIRLIGGRWRGTRLPVADSPGLRPTSDRVRETVFNWLAPVLPGACVLDLFAGTGALGLEALSRGAARAVLVERDRALADSLQQLARRLPGGDAAQVVNADALVWLATQARGQFDIAFIDPPFGSSLWTEAMPVLLPLLRADGWLYIESANGAANQMPPMPGDWCVHREGTTHEVRYALYRRALAAADTLQPDQ